MAKGLSLLDKAKAIKAPLARTWFNRLPDSQRAEVEPVLRACADGTLDVSIHRISALLLEEGVPGATYHKVRAAVDSLRKRGVR